MALSIPQGAALGHTLQEEDTKCSLLSADKQSPALMNTPQGEDQNDSLLSIQQTPILVNAFSKPNESIGHNPSANSDYEAAIAITTVTHHKCAAPASCAFSPPHCCPTRLKERQSNEQSAASPSLRRFMVVVCEHVPDNSLQSKTKENFKTTPHANQTKSTNTFAPALRKRKLP